MQVVDWPLESVCDSIVGTAKAKPGGETGLAGTWVFVGVAASIPPREVRARGQFWDCRRLPTAVVHRKEVVAVVNKKQTGSAAAKAASKVLRDGRSGKASKTAAGSALSQTPKHTGKKR